MLDVISESATLNKDFYTKLKKAKKKLRFNKHAKSILFGPKTRIFNGKINLNKQINFKKTAQSLNLSNFLKKH